MWIISRFCLILAIFLVFLSSLSAQFAGGSGSATDPWQIETIEHLNNIRVYLGEEHNDKHFVQIADLDLGISPWNEGGGWIAIGHYNNPFCGTVNGNGKIIQGIFINRPSDDYQGLFGLTNGAMLINIGLTNVDIYGDLYVGGLVGYNFDNTLIENCFSFGIVRGNSDVGGLVGHNSYSIVSNSYSSGNVLGNNSNIGGLIGLNSYSTLINSYSKANVQGDFQVGGLVGYHFRAGIIHCYSTGVVSGSSGVGGLVGRRVTGGGFLDTNNYWNIETSGQTSSSMGWGRTIEEMTYPYAVNTFEEWDFEHTWQLDENHETNQGYPYLRNLTYSLIEGELITQPDRLAISNYPNPFNAKTTFRFYLPQKSLVNITIFNIKGEKVRSLLNEVQENGEFENYWNGLDDRGRILPSGVYFYQLSTIKGTLSKKMIMIK